MTQNIMKMVRAAPNTASTMIKKVTPPAMAPELLPAEASEFVGGSGVPIAYKARYQ